ncbi:MAG: hydrogenase expression/formation protein HypE [Bacteroidetes bacterium]|nr:hydrogenase expression/formation protein HypE [Bacteroidota bacterium]
MKPLSCPVPISHYDQVLLAHGGGGKLTHQLIRDLFHPILDNEFLRQDHDGSEFPVNGNRLVMTTDSFVVKPIFFPGGNIGELAVNGTVNDLACCGARPLYLSVGLIIEEGLPMADLKTIMESMKKSADLAGVQIITGDTKVVDKGKGDQIFINTTGIGVIERPVHLNPKNVRPGDAILINGSIADHGICILSSREGLEFETTITSDTQCLNGLVEAILEVCPETRVIRDPTRGGLASTLNEIAESSQTCIELDEASLPVSEEVKGACELLGLDPLYVANEGKILVIVPEEKAEKVLDAMKKIPSGTGSCQIGKVKPTPASALVIKTSLGSSRIVDMISGEQLPRIC